MYSSYVNKKIDSLGRVVIPKEIRKQMHLQENESLEIMLDSDNIIIKRASNDKYDEKIFNIIIDTLKKELNINIDIYRNNGFITKKNKDLKIDDINDILKSSQKKYKNYILYPIIPNGVLFGGIIIEEKDINEEKNIILNLFRKFIEKYLEE